jgi:putative copper resistance protein D
VPRKRGRGERAAALAVVASCLTVLSVQLRIGDRLVAGGWFLELRWSWVDPVADQQGGALLLGAAGGLALLAAGRELLARRR